MQKVTLKSWYVYIVRCKNGALYTGITNHVNNRIYKHNTGKGARSVKAHGLPVRLHYLEKTVDKSTALKREAQIKKMTKSDKEKLVMQSDSFDHNGIIIKLNGGSGAILCSRCRIIMDDCLDLRAYRTYEALQQEYGAWFCMDCDEKAYTGQLRRYTEVLMKFIEEDKKEKKS